MKSNCHISSQTPFIYLLAAHLPPEEINPSVSSYLSRWKYKSVNECHLSTTAQIYFLVLYEDNIQLNAVSCERVLTKGKVEERPELRQDLQRWTLVLWCVWKDIKSDGSCLSGICSRSCPKNEHYQAPLFLFNSWQWDASTTSGIFTHRAVRWTNSSPSPLMCWTHAAIQDIIYLPNRQKCQDKLVPFHLPSWHSWIS